MPGALDGATGADLRAEARRILRLELGSLSLFYLGDPLQRAVGLLNTPRADWPKPADRMATAVAAVANTVLQLQAQGVPRGRAEVAVAMAWAQIVGGATK